MDVLLNVCVLLRLITFLDKQIKPSFTQLNRVQFSLSEVSGSLTVCFGGTTKRSICQQLGKYILHHSLTNLNYLV